MTSVFKKNLQLCLGMLMGLTAQVNGMDYYQSTCCEPENCGTESSSISLKGELLYWRPELCGLEGAFGNTTIATTVNENAITITTVTEKDEEPKFKWNTGFRIGADFTYNCFDIELDWTHFNGCAKFSDGPQFGNWKIKYDVIDLTLGRNFCFASCVNLRPFIGVRAAQIRQKLKSHLETLFTSSLIGNNIVFTDKDDSENFYGVGPEIGLYADWCLGCNISLYGSFAVVSYYGHAKSKNFDTDTFTQTVSVCNGERHHCFNNLATDLAIGVRWDTCLTSVCGCDVFLMVNLGLEQHRIYDFSELGADGNLGLDGGVFGAGLGLAF